MKKCFLSKLCANASSMDQAAWYVILGASGRSHCLFAGVTLASGNQASAEVDSILWSHQNVSATVDSIVC